MCTKNQLEIILRAVAEHAKSEFGEKLNGVILYGSYARGDYDSESDIDIMILADKTQEELKTHNHSFIVLSSDLGLEHDIVVSILIKDVETFDRYSQVLPFYRNIVKEGVKIA